MISTHKIDVDSVKTFLRDFAIEIAQTTTLDQTQTKRLRLVGGHSYVVDRWYPDEDPEVIYWGVFLDEAVRRYNGLS